MKKYTVLCSFGPERHDYRIFEYESDKMPNDLKKDLVFKLINNNGVWLYPKIEIIGVN